MSHAKFFLRWSDNPEHLLTPTRILGISTFSVDRYVNQSSLTICLQIVLVDVLIYNIVNYI